MNLDKIREAAERIKLTAEQISGIAELDDMNGFVWMGMEIQQAAAGIIHAVNEEEKPCEYCAIFEQFQSFKGTIHNPITDERVIAPTTHCPACGRKLKFWDGKWTKEQQEALEELWGGTTNSSKDPRHD